MVVNCEKCGSTLRVDESRIPDAGVIARCTICSHRFLLKKEQKIADSPIRGTSGSEGETASTKPAPEQMKTAEHSYTPPPAEQAAPKKEEVSPSPAVSSPASSAKSQTAASSSWDFSSFFADEGKDESVPDETMNVATVAGTTVDGGTSEQQEIYEMPYEVQEINEEDEIVTGNSASTATNPEEYASFTKTPEQQSVNRVRSEEQVVRRPAQEIVTDDQRFRQMVPQQPDNGIISLLDENGLSDDYVVKMVQEVCGATKYVEGVEKPDWPIRLQGLDILCKIKGLYPTDKKNDPANRQVQIVTGINM